MKIVQVVDGYRKGDGVGNVIAALNEFLKRKGYETLICSRQLEYADIDSEIFGNDTVVFYHLALLSDPIIRHLKCKKILIFHNITEPELLEGAHEERRIWASAGMYDTAKTAGYFDMAITFSEYSRKCLVDMGWHPEDIYVLPILVRFDHFSAEPSKTIIETYKGNSVNILFTGRVYPNKKQEDVIAAFAAYKEKYQKNAKLFLVGSIAKGNYYPSLLAYAAKLGVSDSVIFTGHVTFAEYLAYYYIADIYLCMSAHEGFCIPLAEAMYFGIPIIAHASTAVPDTLGGSGILLYSRVPEAIAEIMDTVVTNDGYRQEIIDGQYARLEQLQPKVLEERYLEILGSIITRLDVCNGQPVPTVENHDKFQFSLIHDLIVQMGELAEKSEKYVIYGAGAAGTRLYAGLRRNCGRDKLVLCDSFKSGQYDRDIDCNIITPKEAVESYGKSIFIISIQEKKVLLEIGSFLLGHGIPKERIYIYDKLNNQII